MQRAIISMFAVSAVASLAFGPLAPIALVVLLIATATMALPLFLVLKRFEKLEWWHVVLAGALVTLTTSWLWFAGTNPGHRAFAGPSQTALYLAIGLASSAAYWWLGVFRNKGLPFVSRKVPYSMVLVAPLVVLAVIYQSKMIPVEGPVGCIEEHAPLDKQSAWEHSEILVRMPDGNKSRMSLGQGSAGVDLRGSCLATWQRPTVTLTGTRYLLSGISEGRCGIDC